MCYLILKLPVLQQWHSQFCVATVINLRRIWGPKAGGSISALNLHHRGSYQVPPILCTISTLLPRFCFPVDS